MLSTFLVWRLLTFQPGSPLNSQFVTFFSQFIFFTFQKLKAFEISRETAAHKIFITALFLFDKFWRFHSGPSNLLLSHICDNLSTLWEMSIKMRNYTNVNKSKVYRKNMWKSRNLLLISLYKFPNWKVTNTGAKYFYECVSIFS